MSLPRFGVQKPVPVNILMFALIVAGLYCASTLRREFFPEIEPDLAMVTLPYPGATPEEVETALAIKVEDKLADLKEVKELRTTLTEGGGGIMVEFHERVNPDRALNEVERAINTLQDLPPEAERIQVQLIEPRLPVIRIALYGDMDAEVRKRAIRALRDDLQLLPNMGEITVDGVRGYEISVEVDRTALIRHGISLPQVADAIGLWMRDIPGGTVRSGTGNIRVRTLGVPERAENIRQIIIRSDPAGRTIRVEDIASVTEDFVDEQLAYRHNGKPAAGLTIYKVGDQDIVNMAQMVRAYVDARNNIPFQPHGLHERILLSSFVPQQIKHALPTSSRLEAWRHGAHSTVALPANASVECNFDLARFVEGRLDLLIRNALYGVTLVFLSLLLLLNWRAAMWTGVGLFTAMMGTLLFMAYLDISLNLLTMFGLIVVLGLLVDDAIVVSENIQAKHDEGEPALIAAVQGANQVLWPVVATVLTSIVAFLPLSFIKGQIGDMLGALPLVVACALAMSLIESLLILPSHMGHSLAKREHATQPNFFARLIRRMEKARDDVLMRRIVPLYGRVLRWLLRHRYPTIAFALATLMVSLALVQSKRVEFTFLPASDSETIIVHLRMPIGTPMEVTMDYVQRIEQVAQAQLETWSVASSIGVQSDIETGASEAFAPHVAQLFIELHPVERRDRESGQVIDNMRLALGGQLDGIDRIRFTEIGGGPEGEDISIRIRGADLDQLDQAARQIRHLLASYDGVFDITDDNDKGQIELQFIPKPTAVALNISQADISRQIRGYLFGIDAHVFADMQEDIDVRVRLDAQSRRSLYTIENAWVISPTGAAVPLSEIADVTEDVTYATIKRVDRQRAVTVTANTAMHVNPEAIVDQLRRVRVAEDLAGYDAAPMFTATPSADRHATAETGAHGFTASLNAAERLKREAAQQGMSPIDYIRSQYPQLRIEFAGRQEQMADAFATLPLGFAAAVIMIYVILAWLFASFTQPLIVLIVVPFSTIGVIWGHLIFGYQMTFLSLIGFVALSGIVVNDSLILVKFFSHHREEGHDVLESLIAAGMARFRPILLTTITTFLGLTPLMLETSFQAKFLIPMAIAIAMGLVAATVLVLVVLPCFMMMFNDWRNAAYFLWYGQKRVEV